MNSADNYKSSKISIGTVTKNSEILRLALDHLKTKKCVNTELWRCVLDQYKTQQICDKNVSVPDFCKSQQLCDKAVDDYPHTLEFVLDCYMTQKMCDKTVNTHYFTMQVVTECYKRQEICDKGFNKYLLAFFIFLINIKLKNLVADLFLKIFFQ